MIEAKIKQRKRNLSSELSKIPIEKSWSFADKTIKDTSYITHGYYTYPAKFIPQLASRLILEHSKEGDIVVDPFLGSGTTVIESLVNKRIGIGVDINNIAYLIAKVKSTPINFSTLSNEFTLLSFDLENRLNGKFDYYLRQAEKKIPNNPRIDYWFKKEEKEKLSIIFSRILEIENNDVKDFFLVAFAQILKSCSIWLQKSVKPTRDFKKNISEPTSLFLRQCRKLLRKHNEFDNLLNDEVKRNIKKYRIVQCGDSREIPCDNNKATLIVTSPPYVTSYEYADLHQLPSLWFSYLNELSEFRKKFIGSSYKERSEINLKSSLADEIVRKLGNGTKALEVKNYFADMFESFIEMKRVLKKHGKACIVIGNTQLQKVDILNAEVFQEQFENIGFKTYKIVHREIPSKMLPSTRDPKTGKFTTVDDKGMKLAYPTEYILVMEKQ
ncbi:MAG: site-specific DNA-methyltransferase [Ignavibacteriales bacterium]|nr:site-specific DNA-methyltransferase [Ignavibacteriales bacterium]